MRLHAALPTCGLGRPLLRTFVAGVVLLLSGATGASPAQTTGEGTQAREAPRRVLVLSSFSADFGLFREVSNAFKSELVRSLGAPVDFFDVPVELARSEGPDDSNPFVGYLAALFATRRVDLVVTIGGSAASFARVNRARLFPDVPLLLAAADERLVMRASLGPRDATVPTANDLAGPIRMIRQLRPETENVAIVLGSSPLERFWKGELVRELAPFERDLRLIWLDGLSIEELRERIATLPPRSAVYFTLYLVDRQDVPFSQNRVFEELHKVSNSPIFGLFDSQVGLGAVGGRLMSLEAAGGLAASAAARLLQGADPTSVRYPPLRPSALLFDGRELAEWKIPERLLPEGSEVRFRRRSAWQAYRWQILAMLALLGVQTALIAILVAQRARRREAEREVRNLHGRLLTAYELERRRLARELHDDMTQRLARLAIDAAQAERQGASGEGATTLRGMREELTRLGRDVHALSRRLHPSILDDLGLVEALRAETEQFAARTGLAVDASLETPPAEVPQEVAICLFRVAQEALRNVQQHARARRVDVGLRPSGAGVELEVADDGAGFDPAVGRRPHSIGLAGMRERMHLVRGRLTVESGDGLGTRIRAWAPLAGSPA